ncbi:MAG: relaxase/mobilization nuclease domain-containing protein [Bacteroidaceae bacterium]|nr:relaxase/mobilization nuclease domain-containing protein [Bacteroidaceae bacterium]
MATTKIWDVSAHVSKLLTYVANKNKTTMEIKSGTDDEEMRLAAEMLGLPSDHFATEEKKFVTGINCTLENANEVMLTLLEGISPSDLQAYHGYQSFKPGEVTPDVAHAIGIQLANELWGEDFPIIIATHIDRGHVHNHFCIPATGFSGRRYHDCNATYKLMRDTSDRLCREYGLSVIENPSKDKHKHIAEVHAEKKGIPTMRDQIRADIDAVANNEILSKNFYNRMRSLGYTFERRGQYLRIKPYGYNKFFRLDKLGAGYTEEDIEARIKKNAIEHHWTPIPFYQPTLREKPRGLYALYLHYCYLLGVIPKVIPKNPEAYAAIKEDVRRARMYSEQAKFLGKYGLDTKDDLIQHALGVREQMNTLCKERQKLRNKMRWMKDPAEMQLIREQIFAISDKLKPLRKEYAMCKDIYDRSDGIEKTVERVEFPQLVEQEKQKAALKKNGREER